jgi:ribosomal-protein-alanine N-acetyltransferase
MAHRVGMTAMQSNQPPPIVIEPARLNDIDDIVAIENQAYRFPWSRSVLLAEINGEKFSYVYVARLSETSSFPHKLIGYHYFWVVSDEVHILNLAVAPDYQRHGYGRQLLQFALDFGRERGAISAFLEVRASNTVALQLYTQLGFFQIGTRKKYYGTEEDAYVLKKRLDK